MWNGSSVVAVVPARGGSKGIPRKNLAELGGKSLVRHAIDAALACDWVDLTVLSTDDQEIADEGVQAGIEVPSLRPAELATDLAPGHAVWRQAHLEAETREGSTFEISMLIQPTSPFRRSEDLRRCVELLDSGFDSATTVSVTPSHFAPEKTFLIDDSGTVKPYLPDAFQLTRQLIPTYYHLNGICYTARRDVILEHENVFSSNPGAVVVDRPLVNIDDPQDLELARWLWDRQ
jgi:CMP-N-acetylneuraminic acid synthetase